MSHVLFMGLFALLVSIVFAVLLRDDLRAQLRTAGLMFGAFLLAAMVAGWLMYPFPL